jgi:hypothetical protein
MSEIGLIVCDFDNIVIDKDLDKKEPLLQYIMQEGEAEKSESL